MNGPVFSAVAQDDIHANGRSAAGDKTGHRLEPSTAAYADDSSLHEQLGLAAFRAGDRTRTKAHLSRVVELDPSADEARFTLLRMAMQDESRASAADLASDALRAGVSNPRVLLLVAKAFKLNRDHMLAGEAWGRLAEQRGHAEPAVEAAEAHLRARAYETALVWASAAVARDPVSIRARLVRLQALDKSRSDPQRLGEAFRDLAALDASAALEQLPVLFANGLHHRIADLVAAHEREGASIDPILLAAFARTLRNVARRAEAEQRYEEAGRAWKVLLTIEAESGPAADGLAAVFEALLRQVNAAVAGGDHREAARLLRIVVALDDTNLRAWHDLGVALGSLGDWHEAASAWLRCAEMSSEADRPAAALKGAAAARKVESVEAQLGLLIQARKIDPNGRKIRVWGDRIVARVLKTALAGLDGEAAKDAVRPLVLAGRWDRNQDRVTAVVRKLGAALRRNMREAERCGDGKEAAILGQLVLSFDPRQIQALKFVARNAYQERRFQEAADLYARLVELEPAEERHYLKLGRAYRSLRCYDKGISVVRRLLELHPGHEQGCRLFDEMLRGKQAQSGAS